MLTLTTECTDCDVHRLCSTCQSCVELVAGVNAVVAKFLDDRFPAAHRTPPAPSRRSDRLCSVSSDWSTQPAASRCP